MINVTEPQVWTLIGVLGAALFGMITLIVHLTTRTLSSQIEGLRTEMVLRFEAVDSKFDRVEEKFDRVEEKFDQMGERFERLEGRVGLIEVRMGKLDSRVHDIDRDVQAISRNVFPESTSS
ncbi:hypothetical protein G7068_03120 [Leucobacter viscericola]|uniref:Uncharacterized protein n=1 Tax=Leucobacter viscericola TaxID=2714935 RepID=A0A6G7XCV8_9MICO|nr:hypothetical protein [Leucobacter viscericola]QIK62306.1 hypothetical protein G7068_03120 [Leucobacter viscericola]